MKTLDNKIKNIIKVSLEEDIGTGDITTNAILKERGKAGTHRGTHPKDGSGWVGARGRAEIIAKENLIVSGLYVAKEVFNSLDKNAVFKPFVKDGEKVKKGQCIAEIKGNLSTLLTGERVALNFLQRLSGIATLTHQFVEKVKGYDVKILDTRKTTPGLRILEKYAVRCGGGFNHRCGLYDSILIKDNHIAAAGGIKEAVSRVRKNAPKKKVEVEVKNFKELKGAIDAKVDVIMLDNMKPSQIKKAVSFIHSALRTPHSALIEASGGVNLKNIKSIAKTAVDFISVGALTHSARAVDISMEIVKNSK